MQIFLRKIVVFIIPIVVFAIAILLFNFFIVKNQNLIENNPKKHLLFLGDSNMECAINDTIYKEGVNMAASADSYFYSYLKLKKISKQNPYIDTVLLTFAPHDIFDNGWLKNEAHIKSRMYKYYPLMDFTDFRFLLSIKAKAVLTPSILKGSIKNIIKFFLNKETQSTYGGYLFLSRDALNKERSMLEDGSYNPWPYFNAPKDNFNILKEDILYLNKIINLCTKQHIKLILISLPKREEILKNKKYGLTQFYDFYDTQYKDIEFIDLSNYELSEDNFGDFIHLNYRGATAFSQEIAFNGVQKLYNR